MITRIDFAAIDAEVREAVEATFNHLRDGDQNDYLLLLADAEYKSEYDTPDFHYNPHMTRPEKTLHG